MPEPANQKPAEGAQEPPPNTEEQILKTEHTKVVGEKEETITKLQTSLEEAQDKLLSPEYIQFLASRGKPPVSETPKTDGVQIPEALTNRITQLETSLQNVAAIMELQQVRSVHEDFDELREDIQKLIKTAGNTLTFEQAYKLAKADKQAQEKPPEKKPAPKPTEKPGTFIPNRAEAIKEFKTEQDAGLDAVNQVMDKHGLSGDII